jgi:hypothetical protein
MKPTPKVTAGAAGASLATVLVLGAVWLGAPQPPAGFEGALAAMCGFLAGYFKRG